MIPGIKRYIKKKLWHFAQSTAESLFETFKLDSRSLFYSKSGILKCSDTESGEIWFINNILPDLLTGLDSPVIIDIGANTGHYSIAMVKAFPSCRCYSCEPNPKTFEELVINTKQFPNISPVNYGVGSRAEELEIFIYKDSTTSGHASLYKDVFTGLYHLDSSDVESLSCKIDRIDFLVEAEIIPEASIHFIKIDTEGHELEGLRGSIETISRRGVRAIQFEFNECNVVSRVFLKDFYELLGDQWDFFRLDTKRLIALGRYDSSNEIFKFQNIVAIRRLGSFK